jgi:dienelactone hydrolase
MERERPVPREPVSESLPGAIEGGSSATPSLAPTARIELHHFISRTVTDEQFLRGSAEGKPATLGGELRLPSGTGRIPVVILVHGSAGIGANVDRWAKELNGLGVGAFLLDCFTGRGITQTITDQSLLGGLTMIVDAYRALELLSNHVRIEASRIALMGFSKGGFVALYASLKRFHHMHGPANAEFIAHIPFYPQCNTAYIEDELVSDRPIRLFHGTADDYVSIAPCRNYVERLRRAGKDVQLTEYAGAGHAFDNPLYSPARFLPDAVTTNHCLREELPGGEIVDRQTRQPFDWNDPCVKRGATVNYDALATANATEAVRDFLVTTFKFSI